MTEKTLQAGGIRESSPQLASQKQEMHNESVVVHRKKTADVNFPRLRPRQAPGVGPSSEYETHAPLKSVAEYPVLARRHLITRSKGAAVTPSLLMQAAPPTPPTSPRTHQHRLVSPPLPEIIPLTAGPSPPRCDFLPIIAHPLAPTSHPIHNYSDSRKATILVSPLDSFNELVISMNHGKRTMEVLRGGQEVVMGGTRLCLNRQSTWGSKEKKEWETIHALVDRVKRSTPRVSPQEASVNL